MTYVIDKLEQKGLISRNACPDDRRVIHVTLTDDGIELMNEIMPNFHEFIHHMFNSLVSVDAKTLVQLLKKVKNKV